jgi:hypothetical protein
MLNHAARVLYQKSNNGLARGKFKLKHYPSRRPRFKQAQRRASFGQT